MTFGPYPAVVSDWHDGDTCHLDIDLGFGLHATGFSCRIFGINAPELSAASGKTAATAARQLCPNGTAVTLLSHSWDKYGGRFDGSLELPDGSDFATRMLAGGYAVKM